MMPTHGIYDPQVVGHRLVRAGHGGQNKSVESLSLHVSMVPISMPYYR